MELCGEVVKHKIFGRGQIVEFANNHVTVVFDKNEEARKFTYPDAFELFLELENKLVIKQIEEDKNVIAQKDAERKRINEVRTRTIIATKHKEEKGKKTNSATSKSSDKNNIAFKCNYCDGGKSDEVLGYKGVCSEKIIKYNIKVAKHVWCSQPENMCYKYLKGEVSREEICKFYEETKSEFSKSVCYESQMLEIWNAGAGIIQKGDEKGKPMSLRNVKANSLSLLTSKLPYAEDNDRFIFAVFLIDESYEGDNREEGYVGANPKYRIQLSLDEAKELKFWDYYFNENKPEKIIFGSGLHRYITDIQAAQVLKKICEIKKGTSGEMISKEFLEYYCRIKDVDIDSIPVPNGALQRIKRENNMSKEKSPDCVSDISPTRHCKACGQDFGGGNSILLFEMNSLEFFVGGYFGTSHYIYIDGKRKNKVIRYAKTPGGMYVDLRHPKNEINMHSDKVLKEISLTSEQWLAFIEELISLEVSCWKDKYYDNDICDGTQWNLKIRFPYGNKIYKCGSNEYPPCWNKLIKIIEKYIDENIE